MIIWPTELHAALTITLIVKLFSAFPAIARKERYRAHAYMHTPVLIATLPHLLLALLHIMYDAGIQMFTTVHDLWHDAYHSEENMKRCAMLLDTGIAYWLQQVFCPVKLP